MPYAGAVAIDSIRGTYALIVDTDARRRALLMKILQYCGAYAREADSAERAIRLIGEVRPDVLIVELSDLGRTLIGEVRQLKADRGGVVPAIALGPKEFEAAALAGGFDAFLATPFAAWQLCKIISTMTLA